MTTRIKKLINGLRVAIPKEQSRDFSLSLAEREVSALRFVCFMAGTLFPIFGILDYMLFPEVFQTLLIIRFTVVAAVFIIFAFTFIVKDLKSRPNLSLLFGLLLFQFVGAGITAMVYFTGGAGSAYYAGLILVLVTQSVSMPWNYRRSLFSSLMLWGVYFLVCMFLPLNESSRLGEANLNLFIGNNYFLLATIFINVIWSILSYNMRKNIFLDSLRIQEEKKKSDRLLESILPRMIIDEINERGYVTPRRYQSASILFTDFVNFTQLSEGMSPEDVVAEISNTFEYFDMICKQYGVEKIKTIGDSYMCAAGIPEENDYHFLQIAQTAMEMRRYINMINKIKNAVDEQYWRIRIGIHLGPIVAGVVGQEKFAYDAWGDTVNLASRLEKYGQADQINISRWFAMKVHPYYIIRYNGKANMKGKKGRTPMYLLERIRPEFSKDELGETPNEFFSKVLSGEKILDPNAKTG